MKNKIQLVKWSDHTYYFPALPRNLPSSPLSNHRGQHPPHLRPLPRNPCPPENHRLPEKSLPKRAERMVLRPKGSRNPLILVRKKLLPISIAPTFLSRIQEGRIRVWSLTHFFCLFTPLKWHSVLAPSLSDLPLSNLCWISNLSHQKFWPCPKKFL